MPFFVIRSCTALKGPAIVLERKDMERLTLLDDDGTSSHNHGGEEWQEFTDVSKALEYIGVQHTPNPLFEPLQLSATPAGSAEAPPPPSLTAAQHHRQQFQQLNTPKPLESDIALPPPAIRTPSRTKNQSSNKWNDRFQELFRYKMRNGHCNVSARSTADKKLGEWVRTQRRRKNGKGSKFLKPLLKEEEAKLNAIGFDWRCPSKPEWDVRYQQLVRFKQIYGHSLVPRDYSENPALGGWCVMQRKRKRQKISREIQANNDHVDSFGIQDPLVGLQHGGATLHHVHANTEDQLLTKPPKKPSPITDEQEAKLLAIGFDF